MKNQVSVLFLTYNSDWNKSRQTIYSIISQKNVDVQLIISDDGSKENNYEKIKNYLEEKNFTNYVLVNNSVNQGIIKNLLSGLKFVKAKFVKPISPGDFFYNDDSLSYIYEYAKESNASAFFSRALYYSNNNSEIKIFEDITNPRNIKPYIKHDKRKCIKSLLLDRDYILGASLFYKTNAFINALKFSVETIKFCEDIASTFFFVAQKQLIDFVPFYDYKTKKYLPWIWYEYGSGISTNPSSTIIRESNDNEKMLQLLCDTKMVSQRYIDYTDGVNKGKRRIARLLLNPAAIFRDKMKLSLKKFQLPLNYNLNELKKILSE